MCTWNFLLEKMNKRIVQWVHGAPLLAVGAKQTIMNLSQYHQSVKAEANSSCPLEVVTEKLNMWAPGQAPEGESRALHKTKRLQMSIGYAQSDLEHQECNWLGPGLGPRRLPKRKANRAFPFSRRACWEAGSAHVSYLGLG